MAEIGMKEKLRSLFEKTKKKFKEPGVWKKIAFVVAFLAIWCVLVADFKGKLDSVWPGAPRWVIIVFCLVSLAVGVAFFAIYRWQKKHNWGIDKIFLTFAIIFGSMYLIIAPLGSGNDDPNHYYRIYEIANGRFISDIENNKGGGELPDGLSDLFKDETYAGLTGMSEVSVNTENSRFYDYSNTVLYSPFSYLPQVAGMFVGKIFGASPFWLGTLARIFNLLFYVLICFIGFKLMPRFKQFFLILLLSPSIMSNATSLSADAFVVALVFLFVALILYLKEKKIKIDWRYATALGLLSVLIAGCKIAYLPVVFLVLILGKGDFKTKFSRIGLKVAWISLGLVVGLVRMKIAGNFLQAAYPLADDQMNFVIHNPFYFIVVFMKTMMAGAMAYAENIFSSGPMYHGRVGFYSIIRTMFIVVAILTLFSETKKNVLSKKERLYFGLISLIIVLAIAGALYTQYTPQNCENKIGCGIIIGIQGRYFIPAVIVGTAAICKIKQHLDDRGATVCFLALQLFSMMSMLTTFLG